jgi:hypothetical protein
VSPAVVEEVGRGAVDRRWVDGEAGRRGGTRGGGAEFDVEESGGVAGGRKSKTPGSRGRRPTPGIEEDDGRRRVMHSPR